MSNQDSKDIPDTRGRPRDAELDQMTEQIERAHINDALPITFLACSLSESPKKRAKRLRSSISLKELESELDLRFRILPHKDRLVICLGKGS